MPNLYEDKRYNAVIISPYFSGIKKELENLSVRPRKVFKLDIAKLHLHPTLLFDNAVSFCHENMEKIEQVEKMLEDEESARVLNNVMNYWIHGDYELVQEYQELQNRQYLDVFEFGENEIFVNVGACDGKYSKLFAEQVPKYKKIYNMNCMGNSGAFLSDCGNIEIELDSIDNLFADIPVTFVKADVEGAEYNLLHGAKETIKKYKPKLAICCYHQVNDLTDIPLLIKELNPEYKIKLRHYTDTLTETVCYAY